MSLIVVKENLTKKEEATLLRLSKVKKLRTNFVPFPKAMKLYIECKEFYMCPRAIGIEGKNWQQYYSLPDYKIKFKCKIPLFTGSDGNNPDLDEGKNQVEAVAEGMEQLTTRGYSFYNFSTGYGKTLCGMHTVSRLGRRTLWVVFNHSLQKQTKDELAAKTDARVHWFKDKEPKDTDQIVVCGLIKASKMEPKFLSGFQTIVLDEVDQVTAESFYPILTKCSPTYLLGLSATFKKADGLDKILYKYFGEKEGFICRFIKKPNLTMIKFQTDFVPNIETMVNSLGQVQVNKHEINKSLAVNDQRNRLVRDMVLKCSKQGQCLVLSPRTENILWLATNLTEKSFKRFINQYEKWAKPLWKKYLSLFPPITRAHYISIHSKRKPLRDAARAYYKEANMIDYKTVGKKDMDKTKRILIGGLQSCGRGFDCRAKYLFILGIPPNLIQFVGRMRDPFGTVYIFVDKWAKFEDDWKKKALPYLKKLSCQLFFQIAGEDNIQPYILPKRGRKNDESSESIEEGFNILGDE